MSSASAPPERSEGSVVDYATRAIRTRIRDGALVAGQRLVEADLTASLGVSRGALREAMLRLASTGIVELHANRGACVARVTRREVRDIFVARALLEGAVARQVAEQSGKPSIRHALERLRVVETGQRSDLDAVTFMHANERFHAKLLDLSGSALLGRLLSQLQLPQYQAAFFRLFSSRISERSRMEHLSILDALLRGAQDEADRRVRSHVAHAGALMETIPDSVFEGG